MTDKLREIAPPIIAVVVIALIALGLCIPGAVVIWAAWNYAVVGLFALPPMTFWQAYLVTLLIMTFRRAGSTRSKD